MFRELKLSITDEESHLKMRLGALLSDVMTAGWWATHATVTASLAAFRLGMRRRRRSSSSSRNRIYRCVCGHAPEGLGLHT